MPVFPIEMPSKAPRQIKLTAFTLAGESVGEFDHVSQIQDWGVDWLEGSLTWPPMKAADATLVVDWLCSLRGKVGTFYLNVHASYIPASFAAAVGRRVFRLAENNNTWTVDEARIFGISVNIKQAL